MPTDARWRVSNHSRWLWALLQVGFAVCIINIVKWQLTAYWYSNYGTNIYYQCVLGNSDDGESLCDYVYAVCGASLFTTLVLMLTVCTPCMCFAYSDLWINIILTLFGTIWWLVAAILMVQWNNDRDETVQQSYINSIIGLSWTMFVVFLFDWLGCVFMLLFVAYGKFGGAEAGARIQAENERKNQVDQEYGTVMGPAAVGYAAGGHGAAPPMYMGGAPAYAGPPPGYSAPPPGYGAPPPGYGAAQPGYGAPAGGPPAGRPAAPPATTAAVAPPGGVIMAPDIDMRKY